jgi:sporulation protein YlmC with PRC-barrel domain
MVNARDRPWFRVRAINPAPARFGRPGTLRGGTVREMERCRIIGPHTPQKEAAMTRYLFAATMLVTVVGSPVYAQTTPGAGDATRQSEFVQTDGQVLATSLRQKPVYAADRAGLGEIEDVVIESTGAVKAVLIDIGRGSTQRLVAVPLSALEIRKIGGAGAAPGSIEVFIRMSREELERAPLFRTADRKL